MDDLRRLVLESIDENVRPAVHAHGGDVEFIDIIDGFVHLRLMGSCETCPSSIETLKDGIERFLLEEFSELKGIVREV